jgi:hypothetical protein
MENLEDKYSHIKGWGIDADPENEPTYPMKKWTGDDHKRLNYQRPPFQEVDIEILKSNERPNLTAVVGTSTPPSGLSGMLRRYAFKFSEGQWTHWLALIAADRINMVEGIIDDMVHGTVPNVWKERGWNAEWEHNKKGVLTTAAVSALVAGTVVALLTAKNKKSKKKREKYNGFEATEAYSGLEI